MPSPRVGHIGGVIDGRLYITGGSATNGTDNPVLVFDPVINSWSIASADPIGTPAGDPIARQFMAAAVLGCQLFVAGGYDNRFSQERP